MVARLLGEPGQRRIWDLFITLISSLNLKYDLLAISYDRGKLCLLSLLDTPVDNPYH